MCAVPVSILVYSTHHMLLCWDVKPKLIESCNYDRLRADVVTKISH